MNHACVCGKDAACIGRYEGAEHPAFACNECCGHGNEDGWCVPLAPPDRTDYAERCARLERERDELRRAIDCGRTAQEREADPDGCRLSASDDCCWECAQAQDASALAATTATAERLRTDLAAARAEATAAQARAERLAAALRTSLAVAGNAERFIDKVARRGAMSAEAHDVLLQITGRRMAGADAALALPADRSALGAAIAEAVRPWREALQAAVNTLAALADGMDHVNPDCPQDDTCDCENVAAVNDVARRAAALGVTPKEGT